MNTEKFESKYPIISLLKNLKALREHYYSWASSLSLSVVTRDANIQKMMTTYERYLSKTIELLEGEL